MDTARQVLRWAIPGWLLPIFALTFVSVRFILSGRVLTITDFAQGNYGAMLTLLTILASLGVPMGYLVHQIYHWLYWRVPLPFLKRPEDRGYSVLKDSRTDWQTLVGYSVDEGARLEKGHEIKASKWHLYVKDRAVLERYEHNWRLATIAFYFIAQQTKAEIVARQVETLADIYHSLGATLVSLWLGYLLYLVYDLSMHRPPILQGEKAFFLGGGVNLAILMVGTGILRFNRFAALRALIALMHDAVTAFECCLEGSQLSQITSCAAQRKSGERHEPGICGSS
jgi:hypothetical protein